MINTAKIGDYSLIGNCRTAALVSRYGSIDWCCLPEFHSPAIFGALLDRKTGGFFSISPASGCTSYQQYVADSNVLETVFETNDGTVKLIDAFIATTEEEKTLSLFPDHEILRIVQCTSGTMQMKMVFMPTLFYGKRNAQLTNGQNSGIKLSIKENTYVLRTTLPAEQIKVNESQATIEFTIGQGIILYFSFSCSSQSPAVWPELPTTALKRLSQTINYWKNWISQCTYNGIYEEQVRRSALLLKLLTHAPSGAIIAAPTTSLPENAGGE